MSVLVEDLVKSYGRRTALGGISFEVGTGEIFALLGPNGAGKTTTVEIIEGYRQANAGRVLVLGLDPRKDSRRLRKLMGVMLEQPGIYPGIRVHEAIELFSSYYENPMSLEELIEMVGLQDQRRQTVRTLSRGETQRLSFALAIIGRPRLLILDEPTTGMDPRARIETWNLISRMRDEGATVMVTTHLLDEAERIADTVGIIDKGKLLALGSPTQLKEGMDRIHIQTNQAIDTKALSRLVGGSVETIGTNTYEVHGHPNAALIGRIAAFLESSGVLLSKLETGASSLEQVFLQITAESETEI